MLDTFASAEAAKALLVEIRRLTTRPIRFVIDTHYHLDHVAGNAVFAQAGAMIVAQRNVREWIHRENLRMLTDGLATEHLTMTPEQRAFIEAFQPPTVVYEDRVDLYLGSRQLQLRSLPGHTGGDSVVVLADAHIVFTGDLFWRHTVPNTIDASTQSWIETLDALIREYPGYTFVGGHGDVGTVHDVVAFRDYLARLRQLVQGARERGLSGKALTEAVLPQLANPYQEWDYFKEIAGDNITQLDAELDGRKRLPKP